MFYDMLDNNKEAFIFATTEEMIELQSKRAETALFRFLEF